MASNKQPPSGPNGVPLTGIPDGRPKGLFGTWNIKGPAITHITTWDARGKMTGDATNTREVDVITSSRGGKSSNRRQPLPASTTLWIKPTSYERSVVRMDLVQQGKYTAYRDNGRVSRIEHYLSQNMEAWAQTRGSGPFGWWWSGANQTLLEIDNTRNRLITECLLNLKDQKVNLGENLATAKQTVDLFAKHGSTLFRSIRAAKQGNWKRAFGELGLNPRGKPVGLGLSQRYLEYIYGIKPLMGDIYGAYELLKEQLDNPALLVYARRVLRDSYERDVEGKDVSRGFNFTRKEQAWRQDKIQLVGRINSSLSRDVARAGISNPASLAWDLLPWSFVVDWSLPIGSVLAALDATQGLDFVGGYISRTGKRTEVQTFHSRRSSGWVTNQPWIQVAFGYSNVREGLSRWPRPAPYVKNPLSSSHVVTALALLRQIM